MVFSKKHSKILLAVKNASSPFLRASADIHKSVFYIGMKNSNVCMDLYHFWEEYGLFHMIVQVYCSKWNSCTSARWATAICIASLSYSSRVVFELSLLTYLQDKTFCVLRATHLSLSVEPWVALVLDENFISKTWVIFCRFFNYKMLLCVWEFSFIKGQKWS